MSFRTTPLSVCIRDDPCACRLGIKYESDLQRINLNLTAWPRQLEEGVILGFERAEMLMD